MQIILQERERNGTLTTGLLLGLWIGEVLATAEYWLLKSLSVGLRALSWLFRRPGLVASAAMLGCVGGLGLGVLASDRGGQPRTAIVDAKAISTAAKLYRLETGHWPATLEELVPRHLKDLRADPWGTNYALYRGDRGIAIVSAGLDREFGTGDDVIQVSPETVTQSVNRSVRAGDLETLGSPALTFDAETPGWKITALGPGTLRNVGLMSGDVLVKVNGMSFRSADEFLEAFQELRDADRFEIDLVRAGRLVHLGIDRGQLSAQVPQH
jgi:hypothetical protein